MWYKIIYYWNLKYKQNYINIKKMNKYVSLLDKSNKFNNYNSNIKKNI